MIRHLITSALPYANGPLHFGHIAGVYLPADIYYRHKKLLGEPVMHICGSDEHGVAIMLAADKAGIGYQEYVDQWHESHAQLFSKFGVEFDFFGRTSAPYHRDEVVKWFLDLDSKGYIEKRPEGQLYCNSCPRFLPDRYVEGTCYNCGYSPARGDECPNCGEWIDPLKLKSPKCKICNSTDIVAKESEHWYLLLSKLGEKFRPWFNTKSHWRSHVWEYTNSLVQQGLVDRAITRDLSWGIDVPLPGAEGKKLYVWFDAPIGYVSNTKEFLKRSGSKEDYLKDWWNNPETRIIHFIGKDNIIFHALIWPSMTLGTGFVQPPTDVPASHFVNLEGKQFSKSAGWYVDAEKAVDAFGQNALRIYLTSIIPETGDSNFSWDNFVHVNNEFGNKIGNFINRSTSFMAKHFPEGLSPAAFERAFESKDAQGIPALVAEVRNALEKIQHQRAYAALLRLGEVANETFHVQEPWKTIKTDRAAAEQSLALSMLFILAMNAVFLPFLPEFAKSLRAYFAGISDDVFRTTYVGDLNKAKEFFSKGYVLPLKPEPLLPRIESEAVAPFRLG